MVAFQSVDSAKETASAKFVAWMAADDQAREWASRTFAIPANARLQAEGLDYVVAGTSPAVANGLKTFTAMTATAAKQTPQAYHLQGDAKNDNCFQSINQYLGSVINGGLSFNEVLKIQGSNFCPIVKP